MGLDVSVYKNIKFLYEDSDDSEDEYNFYDVDNNKYYSGEIVDSTISYAYSSHNRFREILLEIIGREYLLLENGKINWQLLPIEIPFINLIYFSDCEGVIYNDKCDILYNDFKNYEAKAMMVIGDDYWYQEKYKEWLNVFEFGKEPNSCVVFH